MTDDFVKLDEWTDEDRDKYRLIQVHSGLYYLEIEYVDSSGQRYWHDTEEFSGSNHASVADPLCRRLKERGLLPGEGE